MTTKDEALKLALEALELAQDNLRDHGDNCFLHDEGEYNRCFCGKDSLSNHLQSVVEKLDEALDEALAEQPAQQEPVAWKDKTYGNLHHQDFGNSIPLYTSPPASKPWVGLTDEEIDRVTDTQWASNNHKPIYAAHRAFARAIEARLREENA